MFLADTFRARVSTPDLIPHEGFSTKDIGMRMVTLHFHTLGPSDGRGVFWYARPNSKEDELTAFYCQRSGFKFPGRMKVVMSDGTIAGEPFARDE